MNQKTTLVVLGVTLAIVASLALAPIVGDMASARKSSLHLEKHLQIAEDAEVMALQGRHTTSI